MTPADLKRLLYLLNDATPLKRGHPSALALGAALAEYAEYLLRLAEREIGWVNPPKEVA